MRVIELFGSQLAGKCVLVETDNMAAKGAADSGASQVPRQAADKVPTAARSFNIIIS